MAGVTVEGDTRPPAADSESLEVAFASRWVAATFDSLRIRHYRVLWAGSALSFLAFMMSMTAQSVVAFDLTGSNRAVGFVAFGQGVAMLILAPLGGAVADRVSKRFLLLLSQASIGLTMFGIALLIVTDLISVLFLAMASFVTGVMFSFLGPTRTAYIGELVGPERRGNALALTQVAMNGTRVAGPFIAGGLLAIKGVGAAGTYFVMSAVFVLVLLTLVQLPPSRGVRRSGSSVVGDIGLGLRHVLENPRLLPVVLGFVLITMLGFPYMVVLPGFTKEVLSMGSGAFGVMLGVSAMGGLVMSLVVASLADSPRARALQAASSAGLGVGLILTGLAPTYAVALLTMVLVGAGGSAFQTLNNAIALREASPAYFGRVMSLMMLAWSFNGLVGLPVGVLADLAGERAVLTGMGASVCVVVALLALWQARTPAKQAAPPAGQDAEQREPWKPAGRALAAEGAVHGQDDGAGESLRRQD